MCANLPSRSPAIFSKYLSVSESFCLAVLSECLLGKANPEGYCSVRLSNLTRQHPGTKLAGTSRNVIWLWAREIIRHDLGVREWKVSYWTRNRAGMLSEQLGGRQGTASLAGRNSRCAQEVESAYPRAGAIYCLSLLLQRTQSAEKTLSQGKKSIPIPSTNTVPTPTFGGVLDCKSVTAENQRSSPMNSSIWCCRTVEERN